jgi:hypothetical protein
MHVRIVRIVINVNEDGKSISKGPCVLGPGSSVSDDEIENIV